MANYVEYWIQNTRDKSQAIVYRIRVYEHHEVVQLVQTSDHTLSENVLCGVVEKRTKRGLTYGSYLLTPRKITVFLDRSDFVIVDADMYEELIRKYS